MADLLAGAASDTGRVREQNEDTVRLADADSPQAAEAGYLAVIADGMGGHQRGEVASRLAVEALFSSYYSDRREDGVGPALQRGFQSANEQIAAQSGGGDPSSAMGTTMVAAAVVGDQLTVANVGDSRAYLLRAESATQITRDHSLIAEQVAQGVMTPQEARQSNYRNIVTRALGHRPKLDVDIFEIGLLPDDCVVLCSDGVHGHVEPEEFADLGRRGSPESVSQTLIELAMERGSTDNVSALVIWYQPSPAATPAGDTERVPVGAGARGPSPVVVLLMLVLVIAIIAGLAYLLNFFG